MTVYLPRCKFRSAARVGRSGHGWPCSSDQGLMTIVGPTVVFLVLPTLAANTGNQRCARPSAQMAANWAMVEPIVGILLTRLHPCGNCLILPYLKKILTLKCKKL